MVGHEARRDYAKSAVTCRDAKCISNMELFDLCAELDTYNREGFKNVDSSFGVLTFDSVNKTKWDLVSDVNPRFNVWQATFPNGNGCKECFDKRIDPNWYHKYRYFGAHDKAVLIKEMAHSGYGVRGIMNALGISDHRIKELLTKKWVQN